MPGKSGPTTGPPVAEILASHAAGTGSPVKTAAWVADAIASRHIARPPRTRYTAVDAFAALQSLQELKAVVGRLGKQMDVLVVPTIGTTRSAGAMLLGAALTDDLVLYLAAQLLDEPRARAAPSRSPNRPRSTRERDRRPPCRTDALSA